MLFSLVKRPCVRIKMASGQNTVLRRLFPSVGVEDEVLTAPLTMLCEVLVSLNKVFAFPHMAHAVAYSR